MAFTLANGTSASFPAPDFAGTVQLCGKPFHVVNWERLAGHENFVCLHGGAQNAYSIPSMLVPDLRKRGSVLSFQLPGLCDDIGEDAIRRQYPWSPSLCDDVSKVLDFQNVQDGVFIGYSYGALLALMFAARFPERVSKIILVDLIPHRTEEQFQKIVALSTEPAAARRQMLRVLRLTDLAHFTTEEMLLRGVVRDPVAVIGPEPGSPEYAELTRDQKRLVDNSRKCRFKITDFSLNATTTDNISRVWPYARSIDTSKTPILILHAPFTVERKVLKSPPDSSGQTKPRDAGETWMDVNSQIDEEHLRLFMTDEKTGSPRPNMRAVQVLSTEHGSVLSTGKVQALTAIENFLDTKF